MNQFSSLFDWFANRQKASPIIPQQQREIAKGLWTKCEDCHAIVYTKEFRANRMVCLECGHHQRISCHDRVAQLIDPDTWMPFDEQLQPSDPLGFTDLKPYSDRLRETQQRTGLTEAVITGTGQIEGSPIVLGVMDFRFIAGSMGSVVGEKLTRAIESATDRRTPMAIVCAAGGARMQEGIFSLMQMAKVSAALEKHRAARLLYVPILTDPTTGGVIASFAMLGDTILAEPKARVAFAGRRVIEQTLREKLPDDFQTAEYYCKQGFVDRIVPRPQLKRTLAQLVRLHQPQLPVTDRSA